MHNEIHCDNNKKIDDSTYPRLLLSSPRAASFTNFAMVYLNSNRSPLFSMTNVRIFLLLTSIGPKLISFTGTMLYLKHRAEERVGRMTGMGNDNDWIEWLTLLSLGHVLDWYLWHTYSGAWFSGQSIRFSTKRQQVLILSCHVKLGEV